MVIAFWLYHKSIDQNGWAVVRLRTRGLGVKAG
jgi:hypothetical protein